MTRHVRRFDRLSKIGKTDEPVALFASMIAVLYDNAVLANGYGKATGLYLSHCRNCRASKVTLNR